MFITSRFSCGNWRTVGARYGKFGLHIDYEYAYIRDGQPGELGEPQFMRQVRQEP
jgi:hypothetical protein